MEIKKLTQQQLDLIAKPLPIEAVKEHPTKTFLSTIKAIYVTERFNEVFGVGEWVIKTDVIKIGDSPIRVTLRSNGKEEFTVLAKTIFEVPVYGIYYECVASSTNDDLGDAAKGAATDAITKIGSYIGIGIDVFKGKQTHKTQHKPQSQPQSAPATTARPTIAQSAPNEATEAVSAAKLSEARKVANELKGQDKSIFLDLIKKCANDSHIDYLLTNKDVLIKKELDKQNSK